MLSKKMTEKRRIQMATIKVVPTMTKMMMTVTPTTTTTKATKIKGPSRNETVMRRAHQRKSRLNLMKMGRTVESEGPMRVAARTTTTMSQGQVERRERKNLRKKRMEMRGMGRVVMMVMKVKTIRLS